MELPRWTILLVAYLALLLTHATHGMPTQSSTDIGSNNRHSPIIKVDDLYLKEKGDGSQLEVTGRWTTRRPYQAATRVVSDSTPYDSKLVEDEEESELATEAEEWSITPNYEPISVVDETLDELSTSEMTDPPFNIGAPQPSSSAASVAPLTGTIVEDEEELEEDLELVTEGPAMVGHEVKAEKPAELRKPIVPDAISTSLAKFNSERGGSPKSTSHEHDGIGTVFSLNDDFTDTHLAIAGVSEPSNDTIIEEISDTLATESAKLSTDSEARNQTTSLPPMQKQPKLNTTNVKSLVPTPKMINENKTLTENDISMTKATTEMYPTSALTSQFTFNDSVLEMDETVDVQLVATNVDAATETLATEDADDMMSTFEVPTAIPTTSKPPIATTSKPFIRRIPTSRPNTSPRPTIRRRITDPMTSTSELSFLITSTTTELPPIKPSPDTSRHLPIRNKPLNKGVDSEATVSPPPRPSASTSTMATTTRKQFMVTVPPLEDDVTEASHSGEVEEQGSSANRGSEENETLSSATSINFNGLWSIFSVEATNAIIISGIIGGCAIIFFSIVMVFCMWRQHVSRRPVYPPTESSNCSSNSSASSFPASKSG